MILVKLTSPGRKKNEKKNCVLYHPFISAGILYNDVGKYIYDGKINYETFCHPSANDKLTAFRKKTRALNRKF